MESMEDADRIVACVNACTGIKNELLVEYADIIQDGLNHLTKLVKAEEDRMKPTSDTIKHLKKKRKRRS